jgi:hypothetical protein
MAAEGDRRLGFIFGIIGGLFLLLAALVRLLLGVVFFATGHAYLGVGSLAQSVIYLLIGLVIAFFAFVGRRPGADRSLAAGVVLIVLSILGWFTLGFGASLLALIGAVFALIAGILFVVAGR